jgi:hypothetical protein
MKIQEVLLRAIARKITWFQAALLCSRWPSDERVTGKANAQDARSVGQAQPSYFFTGRAVVALRLHC